MAFDPDLIDLGKDVGNTPQREVPALAGITQQILDRPRWEDGLPLAVAAETWAQARDEMLAIQKARGFPLAVAPLKRQNFLLRGVPVVIGDEA